MLLFAVITTLLKFEVKISR